VIRKGGPDSFMVTKWLTEEVMKGSDATVYVCTDDVQSMFDESVMW
jgi:hypothetical protein